MPAGNWEVWLCGIGGWYIGLETSSKNVAQLFYEGRFAVLREGEAALLIAPDGSVAEDSRTVKPCRTPGDPFRR